MPIGPMKPDGGRNYRPAQHPAQAPSVFQSPPPPPQPRPTYYSPTVYASNTGQYSSSNPTPPPPPPKPPAPSIDEFLGGDSGYQDQIRQLAKALADFQSDATRRRGNLDQDFASSNKGLQDQRTLDLEALKNSFGSRGLIRSGLYGDAVGDYEGDFNERVAEIARRQQEALALLQQQTGQFTSQQELSKGTARETALRRRAEAFGV